MAIDGYVVGGFQSDKYFVGDTGSTHLRVQGNCGEFPFGKRNVV